MGFGRLCRLHRMERVAGTAVPGGRREVSTYLAKARGLFGVWKGGRRREEARGLRPGSNMPPSQATTTSARWAACAVASIAQLLGVVMADVCRYVSSGRPPRRYAFRTPPSRSTKPGKILPQTLRCRRRVLPIRPIWLTIICAPSTSTAASDKFVSPIRPDQRTAEPLDQTLIHDRPLPKTSCRRHSTADNLHPAAPPTSFPRPALSVLAHKRPGGWAGIRDQESSIRNQE
ncbi:hypothetical protein M433DRAFT_516274 [Acidomyces richmondensis BFW]|nr:hypothetical protein M433DRAFT_516274 [Acidomyces richmondensis BFW]